MKVNVRQTRYHFQPLCFAPHKIVYCLGYVFNIVHICTYIFFVKQAYFVCSIAVATPPMKWDNMCVCVWCGRVFGTCPSHLNSNQMCRARVWYTCSRFALTLAAIQSDQQLHTTHNHKRRISHIFLHVNKRAHVQCELLFAALALVLCASNRPMLLRVDNLSISFCFCVATG